LKEKFEAFSKFKVVYIFDKDTTNRTFLTVIVGCGMWNWRFISHLSPNHCFSSHPM